jgi:putative sigma-54 modulation protein
MRISTTVRHFEMDPEDKLFAETRLSKVGRFARDIREIHLVVTAEGHRHVAEITLRLKHRDLTSREESTEARRAIDLASDRLEHQLRRLHDRRVDRKRSPRAVNGQAESHDASLDGDGSAGDLEEA